MDINYIANLARLGLDEKEKEKLSEELSVILDYFENLKEADTSEIKPISQIIGLENITRKDEIKEREDKLSKKIINLAPETKDGFVKIKRVLE